jgi:hypothetical protein
MQQCLRKQIQGDSIGFALKISFFVKIEKIRYAGRISKHFFKEEKQALQLPPEKQGLDNKAGHLRIFFQPPG